jgi:predicted CoA-substrate-specific enzyme activase
LNKEKILAGIDAGHIRTKAVLVKGQEVLGYASAATGLDAAGAAEKALNQALAAARVPRGELGGLVVTGIFKDVVKVPELAIENTIPEYLADAKGALFLNKNSRTVIDIGGNVHKAVHYDKDGNLLDVIQNDKCADGLGIYYTTIAKTLGVSEEELSELALKSKKSVAVAIQCGLCAESEAIDLMCQGVDVADAADAALRFIVERVAAMASTMPLEPEVVVAGGLAKSKALMKHLPVLLKHDVSVLSLPEYVGAIGAAISYEGGK